jgi:Methyltransferase domain/Putative zinc binding domain
MTGESKIAGLAECSVCGNPNLTEIASLPNFPITGVFVTESDPGPAQGYEQSYNMCGECGHAQLGHVLPPPDLYGDGYAHRSSASHLTPTTFRFILDYLKQIKPDHRFRSILEIGCNDLMLLNQLAPLAEKVTGIDPIWIDKTPSADESTTNMTVIGNYLEDVDLSNDVADTPDLVISTHNMEHITDPLAQLTRLIDAAADDALFVIEVPDADAMARNLRFDQVFHQHIHYFNLSSFLKMIERAGGSYLDHTINPGNWGGTFIVAFTKAPQAKAAPSVARPDADDLSRRYDLFRQRMAGLRAMLEMQDGDVCAYGAAQMLPTLAYHLESDLSFLSGIYDDCKFRPGLTYPHIPVRIHRPDDKTDFSESAVVITALDAVRPIMNRLRDFNPKYVIVPTQVF